MFFVFNYSFYYSQNGVSSTNNYAIVDETPSSNAFYAQIPNGDNHYFTGSCCGNEDAINEKVIVTYEALNITLTATIIDELQHSTTTYSSGNGVINTGPNLLEYGNGLNVGDVVNIYMVYLNNDENRRTDYGEVTFDGNILSVGFDWQHTLWFSGITNPELGTSDYPHWEWADDDNKAGKFEDRKFEPNVYNNGIWNSDWNNSNLGTGGSGNGNKDWFKVLTSAGSSVNPNYSGSATRFQLGCSNGKKGDFFRIVTEAGCSEPNDAGSINGNESGCDSYDPSNITSISDGSGATGGTATYVWEYSTSSSSGPWTSFGSSNSTTYNPSSISQTTWYRRGYYHCSPSGAVYTSAIEKTVISPPVASASASSSLICSGSSTTLTASTVSGASYAWRVSGNSTVLSSSSTYSPSPTSNTTYELTVTKNGCSSTDNITITVNSNPSSPGSIGNPQTGCGGFDPTTITSSSLPSSGSGGLTYLWEYSTSSSSGPWTNIPPSGATISTLSNDCESSTGWTGTLSTDNTNDSWCIGNGSTVSLNTGPSSAYSGSNYFYYETSGSGWPYNGSIVSPAADLSNSSAAQLSFYLHAYGATIGTINVGVGTSSFGPFTTVYTNSGALGNSWQQITADLTNYVGQTIYIQFDYIYGVCWA